MTRRELREITKKNLLRTVGKGREQNTFLLAISWRFIGRITAINGDYIPKN